MKTMDHVRSQVGSDRRCLIADYKLNSFKSFVMDQKNVCNEFHEA